MPRMIRSSADEPSVSDDEPIGSSVVDVDIDGAPISGGAAPTASHDSVDARQADSVEGATWHAPKPQPRFDGTVAPSVPPMDVIPVALAESIRYLVARFQLNDVAEFPARLGVTSALHGEGVTTISRTLAAIVAHDLDRSVCWVDLTWTRPSKSADGSGDHVGLADVLMGTNTIDDALQATSDFRLSMLGAGHVPPGQSDTFARSPAIGEILSELSKRFACLIMDTPPVLAGSASLGQLRFATSYLLVVRHGVTSSQQIRAATDELTSIPSMGVVLNGYKSKIPKRLSHFFSA